jgi:hypothetical protein
MKQTFHLDRLAQLVEELTGQLTRLNPYGPDRGKFAAYLDAFGAMGAIGWHLDELRNHTPYLTDPERDRF